VAATSRRSSEASFKWSGRGGVVKKFLDHTTPSARAYEASRLFLIVQPPLLLLRRGASTPYPVLVCGQTSFAIWTDASYDAWRSYWMLRATTAFSGCAGVSRYDSAPSRSPIFAP
jgi:hypothetical protein